jgi:hypothetical protein
VSAKFATPTDAHWPPCRPYIFSFHPAQATLTLPLFPLHTYLDLKSDDQENPASGREACIAHRGVDRSDLSFGADQVAIFAFTIAFARYPNQTFFSLRFAASLRRREEDPIPTCLPTCFVCRSCTWPANQPLRVVQAELRHVTAEEGLLPAWDGSLCGKALLQVEELSTLTCCMVMFQ